MRLFFVIVLVIIILWMLLSSSFEKIGDLFIRLIKKIFGGM